MAGNVSIKFIYRMLENQRALTTVVVDIGVIRVVFDRLLEALEGHFGIALFHVDASDLDQALRK